MRKALICLFAAALFFLGVRNVHAAWPVYEEDIRADTICVMETETGVVLMDRGMNAQMYPASVTKILTTLVALENGDLKERVTMSEEACFYVASGSSNLKCRVGEVFTLEQLLYGTMIASANEMAAQTALHIGGTAERFCEMMNARAKEIGCTGTHFTNANGMPDEEHVTSAWDMTLVMREALQNEKFREIISAHTYTIPATNLSEARSFSSHNALLVAPEYMLPGIIGGKTGFTNSALHTLVNAAEREGMTLIVTTFRTADPGRTVGDQVALFEYYFANYEKVRTPLAEFATGNGSILLPKGTDPAEVTEEISEEKDAEGNDCLRFSYSHDGKNCGEIVLTQEAYKQYLSQQEPEAETESGKDPEEEITEAESDEARLARRQKERNYAARQFYILVGVIVFVLLVLLITIITLFVKIILLARKK